MSVFKKQDREYFKKSITIFNNSPELFSIRELYKCNFNLIVMLIKKYGYDLALEDISKLDLNNYKAINENLSLLKKINRAIFFNKLNLEDIK